MSAGAWEDKIRRTDPYTPGEQPDGQGIVKLNTNENPYPPAPGVQKVLSEFDAGRLRLYPDPEARELISALSDYYGVGCENIFAGVGSDDVLATAFLTFFNSDKPVFFPDITYSFYPVWAGLFRIPYETKPLAGDFSIRAEDYYEENGGVVFPNPNAPTSRYEDLSLVEDIIRHNRDSVVIVDEAYIDFAGESALKLLDRYDNLLIVQTFSKSRSMAGMRIGFAIGSPDLIRAMNSVKFSYNSYTLNMPSQAAGTAAVKDESYFRENIARIKETRQRAAGTFRSLGFEFTEPSGNFIFVRHPKYHARGMFEALKKAGIYVRYFGTHRIDDYLRVTVGTDEQMDKLFEFLRDYMR